MVITHKMTMFLRTVYKNVYMMPNFIFPHMTELSTYVICTIVDYVLGTSRPAISY